MPVWYSYTINDIRSSFAIKDYVRGQQYAQAGRVENTKFVSDGKLLAQVQGSRRNPYQVEVQIELSGNKKRLSGHCSCPLRVGCKHIVATLIKGIEIIPSTELVDVTPKTNTLDSPMKLPITSTVAKVVPTNDINPVLDYDLSTWLDSLNTEEKEASTHGKLLIYVIEPTKGKEAFIVSPVTTSILKSGVFSTGRTNYRLENTESYNRGKHVEDSDIVILRLINAFIPSADRYNSGFKIPTGEEGLLLWKLLLATGRCYLGNATLPSNALTIGKIRSATIGWKIGADGTQVVQVTVEDVSLPIIIALLPVYYICTKSNTVGELDLALPRNHIIALLKAPCIKPHQAGIFREKLIQVMGGSSATTTPELLPASIPIRTVDIKPTPLLRLDKITIQPQKSSGWRIRPSGEPVNIAVATLSFNYNDTNLTYHDSRQEFILFKNGEAQVTKRNKEIETERMKALQLLGLTLNLKDIDSYYSVKREDHIYLTIGEAKANFHKDKKLPKLWENFMQYGLVELQEQGWLIKMDASFPYNIVRADDQWYADIEEGSSIDWFGVELGVHIEGKQFNLVPILLDLLKKNTNILQDITEFPAKKPFLIPMKDGRRLALPVERVKILLSILRHLFSFHNNLDEEGKLKLQLQDAALIAEIEASAVALNMRWFGGETLRRLGKNLKEFNTITEVELPTGFHGELRGYQQYGLNWLQFLREYNLSGILADDMGLGKTVQLLAHIATEKACKRLDNPFLVIAPTSLMINWKMEAAKFVPDIKVLVLHGVERKTYFKEIKNYDLVLTTYPLLPRDKDELLTYQYHTIILDEAQTIKNADAKITQIVNQLKARYRLCMTGTPLENHLGELWSLFNFLLPGYLGSKKQFAALFRTPIEKEANTSCNEILTRRIKPFILRRTKQQVVTELPLKTEITRTVELEGTQRDLYETIRVSMQEKIRKEVAAHGMEKSHIIILDALLKLRQVCCDPALLKINNASNINSAKRNELMNMLMEMVTEDRKILLFSQFTGMLQIIEQQLVKLGIDYVKLTGKTKDRETPVRSFQESKVPVFLISLKAGGTGLNLTAADTVIHYDPWWNPAVENQATDRAYRIGQEKPVFVYKLITSGTVEEKIIEMQQKKRQLMEGLFDPTAKVSAKLTANDIQTLFEPL
jgi:superfamily II DNA or RNA helicase